jgi:hypothetical protein
LRQTGASRAIYEARVYAAVGVGDRDLSGVRSWEAASGLGRQTLLDTLPQTGELSEHGLLRCLSRGTFDYDKPEIGEYVLADLPKCDTGWIRNTYGRVVISLMARAGGAGSATPEEHVDHLQVGVPDLSGVLLTAADRLEREEVRLALDPSRDTWAPHSAMAEVKGAGHRGWALALVLGLQDCTLTLSQVQTLTGLSERQNRALVARLEALGLAYRSKQGRSTVVAFLFASVLVDPLSMAYDPDSDRSERARKKRERAHWEAACLRSRRTPHGQQARLLIRFFTPNEGTLPEAIELFKSCNQLKLAKILEPNFSRSWAA